MKTLALSLAVGLCAAPALGQMTIERVAPENSVMVVGMPNVQLSRERFERTPLYDMWMSDEMKQLRDDDPAGFMDEFNAFIDELGVDRDELSLPTGAIGFAMYPIIDEESGRPAPAMLAFADYGTKAGAIGALVLAALDRGERDGMLEFEVKDILGRSVYEIHMLEDDDPFDDAEVDPFDFGGPPNPFDDMRQMYYVQDDNVFLLSSDLGGLTEALDRVDGNLRGTLADRDDFNSLMSQIGRDDFYMVVMMRDLMQIASAFDEMGMLMFVQPTLKALFGDIRGYAMGARLDGNNGMVEGRWSLYMPAGKQGLTRLLDSPAPRSAVPSFIGPDTVMYTSFNFRFNQLVNVIRSVINSNPLLQMQAGEIMEMVEGPVADILGTMGDRTHMGITLSRPLRVESLGSILAIELRDAQQFENLFGQFAPQMGLEARDFLGQRIYSANMGGMMGGEMDSISVGVGGGFLFAGPTPPVEQALRTVSQPDQMATLADEPMFQQAIAALSQRQVVGWVYTNYPELLEAMTTIGQLQQRQWMEEMRREHPEIAEQMEEMNDGDDVDFDFELLRRYIGPLVGEIRSTEEGFVGSVFLLAPTN